MSRLCHPTIRFNQIDSLPRCGKLRRKGVRRCSSGHFEKLLSASSPILGRKGGENDWVDARIEQASLRFCPSHGRRIMENAARLSLIAK